MYTYAISILEQDTGIDASSLAKSVLIWQGRDAYQKLTNQIAQDLWVTLHGRLVQGLRYKTHW
jgi:hypothetical protein